MFWQFAEQLVGERCSEKADMYSFGIVLWELCTLDTPMLRQTRDLEYDPTLAARLSGLSNEQLVASLLQPAFMLC